MKQCDYVSFAVDRFLESFTECASMSDDKDRHHTWSGLRDWRQLGGSTVGRRRATIGTSFPRYEKRSFSIHLPSPSSSGPPPFGHPCQTPNPDPVTRQEIGSKEWDLAWGLTRPDLSFNWLGKDVSSSAHVASSFWNRIYTHCEFQCEFQQKHTKTQN